MGIQCVEARSFATDERIAGESLGQFAVEADEGPVGVVVSQEVECVAGRVIVVDAALVGEELGVLVESQHAHAERRLGGGAYPVSRQLFRAERRRRPCQACRWPRGTSSCPWRWP